jgi:Protein phosphatase 2C
MEWKAIANSVIGTSHQQRNLVCQDYGDFVAIGDIIVGAVADGAGSAKYSDIGSKLAVDSALSHLQGWVNVQKKKGNKLQEPIDPQGAQKLFSKTLNKVDIRLREESNKGYNLKDLACTLLVFIATRNWIAAMQIGDGFIVARSENSDYQLLFKPSKGEFANETTFVTSENAFDDMQVKVFTDEYYNFICASTDGLERLAIDTRTWIPSPNFFNPFERGLKDNHKKQEEESLKRWLNSPEVNARTDDDKTMLVCIYDRGIIDGGDGGVLKDPGSMDGEPRGKKITQTTSKEFSQKIMIQQLLFNILAGGFWNAAYHHHYLFLRTINIKLVVLVVICLVVIIAFNMISFAIEAENISIPKNQRLNVFIVTILKAVLGLIIGALLYYFYLSIGN